MRLARSAADVPVVLGFLIRGTILICCHAHVVGVVHVHEQGGGLRVGSYGSNIRDLSADQWNEVEIR